MHLKNVFIQRLQVPLDNSVFYITKYVSRDTTTSWQGYGLFKRLLGRQRDLGSLRVALQVEARAVSAAHDLDPSLQRKGRNSE